MMRSLARLFLPVLLALALPAHASMRHGIGPTPVNQWQPVPIGNGGLVTRFDTASDGSKVASTDTFGCYRWDQASNKWSQLLTVSALGNAIAAATIQQFTSG